MEAERKIKTSNRGLVKYTTPLRIIDVQGNKLPEEKCIPAEVLSKIERGYVTLEKMKEIQDVLNCVTPPIEWKENGETYMQQLSPEDFTRADIMRLRLALEKHLKIEHAREEGLDAARRNLFGELFDELIRQDTVQCPERGLLLLRIRDEMRLTISALKALFDNGKTYGMRKAAEDDAAKEVLVEIDNEKRERDELRKEMKMMQEKIMGEMRRTQETLVVEGKKHLKEMIFLNQTNTQLKTLLDGILAAKS